MLVNLGKLSAAKLFELATKKQQNEEKKRAETERAALFQKRRETLLKEHKHALDNLDNQILALQEKRAELVARQRAELSALERELTSLTIAENVARRTPDPSPTLKGAILPEKAVTVVERTSATPATIDSTPAVSDDMGQAILDLMKGRSDISENLLRDQLRAKKLDTTKLRNHIETLLKQGKIVNKGYGNFALKRKK